VLGLILMTWHNLQYYQDLMRDLRVAIGEGRLGQTVADVTAMQAEGDIEPC
jgi:queuine tRNA-ribosyltransferase